MPSYERVKSVYCGNTRLNELVGVIARGGVDRLAVDIQFFIGDNGRAAVAGVAHTVEDSAEHIGGNGKFDAVPQKSRLGIGNLQALRTLEKLHYGFIVFNFEHFAASYFAVSLSNLDKFVIPYSVNSVDEHQRSYDLFYGFIFLIHCFLRSPLFF